MNPTLASLAVALALAVAASAAKAESVVRFPPKGGIPYVVQVPDRPSATTRGNKTKYESTRTERRNGRKIAKPNS